ncbi:hypothetical protein F3Y22_tig00111640pilonHSYRG00088 [Hibiscus syriacus]|uniref:Protein arginine N-methyltransferase PRMT10 n=1 Tax=Hibiscus syriacus TaxID=106335 RepID=A0A6A2XJ89_HIBSY|nr:hypothetical protein F3Y22_tig00111640pilonHSYRG00088 [Hibiscus syriacus]
MGSRTNGVAGGSSNRPVDKGADFANYFCSYACLYHQKEMLSDRVRMDAYYNAVFKNKHHFQGKLGPLLDVGTGSGILAIWSAQAGARKVYAVEATKLSEHGAQSVLWICWMGRREDHAQQEIELTTAPSPNNGTYWVNSVA